MTFPDPTSGQQFNTPYPKPPPVPAAPLGYSTRGVKILPLALRVICWAAIVLGLGQTVTISASLLRFGSAGLINSMPYSLFLIIRDAIGVAMVAGGILALNGSGGATGRQVLTLAAWASLAATAYLLIRAVGIDLSVLPSNRPVWSIGIMLLNSINTYLTSAVLPVMILVLMRGDESQAFLESRA